MVFSMAILDCQIISENCRIALSVESVYVSVHFCALLDTHTFYTLFVLHGS